MKKIIFAVLAVIIVLGIGVLTVILVQGKLPWKPADSTSGTSSVPPSTTRPTATSDATEPSVTDPLPQPNDSLVSLSLPIRKEEDLADDGTVIFTYTFQDVVLNLQDSETAKAVTLDLLQRMDGNSAKLAQIQEAAFLDYTGQSPWRGYFYSLLYSAKRVDESVLSLYGLEEFYGNGESETNAVAVTYDLATGNVLKLQDVIRDDTSVYGTLMQALLDVLKEHTEEFQLYSDYADIISADFATIMSESENWYLSDEGLCLVFSPYYIAPHAAGFVTATIPYGKLNGILQEGYFPTRQPIAEGAVTASGIDDVDLKQFSRFCELKNAAGGTAAVLHTGGILTDVRIEQGHLVGGVRYVADATVFLANRLSPDDAVLLEDAFDETSILNLHYSIGEEHFSFRLEKDQSGKVILSPLQ